MSESVNLAEIGQHLEQRFGVNRSLLMGVGLACVLLGVIAMALPLRLFGSLISVAGRPAAHRGRRESLPALTRPAFGRRRDVAAGR